MGLARCSLTSATEYRNREDSFDGRGLGMVSPFRAGLIVEKGLKDGTLIDREDHVGCEEDGVVL